MSKKIPKKYRKAPKETGLTTEIIHGIRRGQFIHKEIDKGSKVLIEKSNGKILRLTIND
jgi:3-isopropylmalate dehydratase small subunit